MATSNLTTIYVGSTAVQKPSVQLLMLRSIGSDVVASWEAPAYSAHLAGYKVKWLYYSGGKWFTGQDYREQAKNLPRTATYRPPATATSVKVYVKPYSTTHTVKKKETAYWTGEVTKATYNMGWTAPSTPSAPSLSSPNALQVAATVSGVDEKADSVVFQFVTADTGVKYREVSASVSNGIATASFTVSEGVTLKARVKACNTTHGGKLIPLTESDWSGYSSNVVVLGSPAVPTGIKVTIDHAGLARISWDVAKNATKYTLEYVADSASYLGTEMATTRPNLVTNSATVQIGTAGHRYYFRVQAQNASYSSGWSGNASAIYSNVPDPASIWQSEDIVYTDDSKVSLYFQYNNASAEDMGKILFVFNVGGTVKNLEVNMLTGSVIRYEVSDFVSMGDIISMVNTYRSSGEGVLRITPSAFASDTVIKWSVYTWGLDISGSGVQSAQNTISIYVRPILSVTVDSEVASFPFNVQMNSSGGTTLYYEFDILANEFYEVTGASGEVEAVNVGDVIRHYRVNGGVSTKFISVTPDSGRWAMGVSYMARATVVNTNGCTATASQSFALNIPQEEYTVLCEAWMNANLTANVTCRVATGGTEDEPVYGDHYSVDVYRLGVDGSSSYIGTLENTEESMLVDPHPALDAVRYRMVIFDTDTGVRRYTDLYSENENPCLCIVMQWDEDYERKVPISEDETEEPDWNGEMLILPYNVSIGENSAKDVELAEYYGRETPVSYYGTQRGYSASWSCAIKKDDADTLAQLRRLGRYMGDVYVREPSGTGYWARVEVSISSSYNSRIVPVSFSIVRVDGGA